MSEKSKGNEGEISEEKKKKSSDSELIKIRLSCERKMGSGDFI